MSKFIFYFHISATKSAVKKKKQEKKRNDGALVKRQTRRLIHLRQGTVQTGISPNTARAQRSPPRRRRCSLFPRSASSRHPQRAPSSDHLQSAALKPARYLSAVSEWRYGRRRFRSLRTNSFVSLVPWRHWFSTYVSRLTIWKTKKSAENAKCRGCLTREKSNLLKVRKKYSLCAFKGYKLTGQRLFLISVVLTQTHMLQISQFRHLHAN